MFLSRTGDRGRLKCDGEFHAQFTTVGPYYDELMQGVPYGMWVDYVELLLGIEGVRPQRVADLACGTGNVSFELARRGYSVTGVDISGPMIDVAGRKIAENENLRIDFQCQDLRSLTLPAVFDLAVCLFDSLNYLLLDEDLEAAFRGVHQILRSGGLFIFDMNSEYALETELFTQDNLFRNSALRYNWISQFSPQTRISEVEMYFEVHSDGALPLRFKELHRERAYSLSQVMDLLDRTGWQCHRNYEAYTSMRPGPRSERWYFVCAPKPTVTAS